MWFTKKYKDRISSLEKEIEKVKETARDNRSMYIARDVASQREITSLTEKLEEHNPELMAALMRESLGLAVDFAAASTDKCMPAHFLEGLQESERKNFIIEMESIHASERFQQVVAYLINLFATNAIYKYDEEQRRNGQIAVVSFRTLLKEFDKMHNEFLEYKKDSEEEFDPLATLPE